MLSRVQRKEGDVDPSGCILTHNSVAQLFNEALLHLCQEIKYEMVDATIVYVDIYSIKYDIISNATRYGELFRKFRTSSDQMSRLGPN